MPFLSPPRVRRLAAVTEMPPDLVKLSTAARRAGFEVVVLGLHDDPFDFLLFAVHDSRGWLRGQWSAKRPQGLDDDGNPHPPTGSAHRWTQARSPSRREMVNNTEAGKWLKGELDLERLEEVRESAAQRRREAAAARAAATG